jgi:predicted glycosyltransferase
MGLGHLNRTLALTRAMTEGIGDLTSLIMTGSPHTGLFGQLERIDWLKLPAIRKCATGGYEARSLDLELRRMINWRASLLLESIKRYRPDVFLVDKSPIGVCGELVPALHWLKKSSPETQIIFGMRDIEDAPQQTISQWSKTGIRYALNEVYDRVWVYGSQHIFDVAEAYQLGPSVADKTEYLGHVVASSCQCPCAEHKVDPTDLLITVGGGTDGQLLIETFIDCLPELTAQGLTSCIVGGPDLPMDVRVILSDRVKMVNGVKWIDFEPCMNCRIASARLTICMGGYNTMTSVVDLGKRGLVVPRRGPRAEQRLRAQIWSDLGMVQMMDPDQLTPEHLSDRIVSLLKEPGENTKAHLPTGACERAVEIISELIATERTDAAAVCL